MKFRTGVRIGWKQYIFGSLSGLFAVICYMFAWAETEILFIHHILVLQAMAFSIIWVVTIQDLLSHAHETWRTR